MENLTLRSWSADDRDLLQAANTPEMTAYLNGPETEEEIDERHARYLRLQSAGEARMFVIVDDEGERLGSIGLWPVDWHGAPAMETGWFVLPSAQGRGVATRALELLIEVARRERTGRRSLMACPGVDNAASNGVCRRAGFTLVGTVTEPFRGADLTVNEWVLDLEATDGGDAESPPGRA
ncbi:GNAT family N-acetyltransferase [Microbacterium hydrocarbonoxydans]|uniref:GNAT family N-acetyltransferase n=1 Tax=Microbacterium hydrocarbonoxydans TaxID=273678 RepID=UPI0007BBDF0F|nr:GNAT family N-acetyltransferase [Microbacterium hydrocarbonoxydans]GAT73273.1 acetyltransferase, ribosomal protein N-acetylase [Microbacterium sp. HM58-2]